MSDDPYVVDTPGATSSASLVTDAEAEAVEEKPAKIADKDLRLQVKVVSALRVYFSGQAVAVSGMNDKGPFDVCPKHANFFSMLHPGPLKITVEDDVVEQVDIGQAIMTVEADVVHVYVVGSLFDEEAEMGA